MKLFNFLLKKDKYTQTDVLSTLQDAVADNVIDHESFLIIKSVFGFMKLRVKDIMVPFSQTYCININDDMNNIVNQLSQYGYSRYPVYSDNIRNIVGIFHVKDLIHYFIDKNNFDFKDYLRKVHFVPDIKKIHNVLYEMRVNQSHLVIVVDEFSNIVGMLTLEMILEQIVGDIVDEYDIVGQENSMIVKLSDTSFRINGNCTLVDLNDTLELNLDSKLVETISGFIVHHLNRIPQVAEVVEFPTFKVTIVSTTEYKINKLVLDL